MKSNLWVRVLLWFTAWLSIVVLSLLLFRILTAHAITNVPGKGYAPKTQTISASSTSLTIDDVKQYIVSEAKEYGVNPTIALFIVSHESQNCKNLIVPEKNGSISYGCWMFNNRNPDFDYACVMSMECSTNLAMQWILDGRLNRWTTWSERCKLYPYDNPPNCSVK